GKTSMAHQFVEGKSLECYEPTAESTYNKVVVVGKDQLQLQVVGTASHPSHWFCPLFPLDEYTILPHSIISIHGYVLVYSVTSLQTFQVIKTLHKKLYKSWGKTAHPAVPCCVLGREVRRDEGKRLAESWGAIFLESSAKESQVTMGIFMKLIEEISQVDNS
ncbi:REBL1 GTPase, partial [Hylia prasina]|nr:REBL1 GTPase [Hylia prasina]